MEKENKYPIKAVALRTGLSIHAIRAWEKRYQAVTPVRTDTNRRLYNEGDIEKLTILKKATEHGHNISSVAGLNIEELNQLLPVKDKGSDILKHSTMQKDDNFEYYMKEIIYSLKTLNARSLESTLANAALQLNHTDFLEKLIIPFVENIGDLWHKGAIRIIHEHMATVVLKNFITNMRNNYHTDQKAPHMIVTTPMGQNHEIGALILSLFAAVQGWNVTYLGPNLPADEIAAAAREKKALAVLLSIVYPADDYYLKMDLMKLRHLLGDKAQIIVGGRMAKNYASELEAARAFVINDIAGFESLSNALKKQH